MKRPIFVATIGYIIGIIVGLYFKNSIVLLYLPLVAIYFILNKIIKHKKKFKLFSFKRYYRYIKIFLSKNVIILIIIISIISNSIVLIKNAFYKNIYNTFSSKESISLTGIVVSNKIEGKYTNKYIVKAKFKNHRIKLYIIVDKKADLQYGEKIEFVGKYIMPEKRRNYKGFDNSAYLKQLGIYGTVKVENLKHINYKKINLVLLFINQIRIKIKNNMNKILDGENSAVILGLTLGDKLQIDEQLKENFKNASMLHILAISGMHITYVILGIEIIFKNLIGKRKTYILEIFILFFYMCLTNFNPSVVRAGVMGIILTISKLIFRRNDILTSMSISLFILLLFNPFIINNIGLQLSYLGVIGIFIFYKNIIEILSIKSKIIENICLSFSIQLTILPILIYNMNIVTPFFLISNLALGLIIGPIIISSLLFIFLSLINLNIGFIFSKLINFEIHILILISNIGKLPYSKIYVKTPSVFWVLNYYLILSALFVIFKTYLAKNPNMSQIRLKNIVALIKIKARNKKIYIKRIILTLVLIILIINFIPSDLKIHFIDVGQGDSCFIITPKKKTILIDGGGSSSFDVGKNTLVPYILDRGYTKIDTIIISHFDSDHVKGILSVMQELKVGEVLIAKQGEESENYNEFRKIVKDKNIRVRIVKKGDLINIEKNLKFRILWPSQTLIEENILNNNSIVTRLEYKKFSMIFTGDIEKIAEEEIIKEYQNKTYLLKANILKVGHHGSKTSSIKEFVNIINPKIAIIGVGKDNKFGHPSDEVIKRLKEKNISIFRTDKNGEISIYINRFNKVRTSTLMN